MPFIIQIKFGYKTYCNEKVNKMNVEIFLFYFFSSIAIISAIMVISAKNPIHSILSLILVFCNAAGLFILLEVEFLAMIFLVVYVGAIAILFLFVVMMLNIKLIELNENLLRYLPVGSLVAIIFLLEIFLMIDSDIVPLLNGENNNTLQAVVWSSQLNSLTNIETLGDLIYTHYFPLFLIASMVLLVSMIGAIILTLNHRENVKRQEIYKQVARDFEKTIYLKA